MFQRVRVFVLLPSITLKRLELQSSNSEPPLSIIPFDIVVVDSTLLWDNLYLKAETAVFYFQELLLIGESNCRLITII